MPARKIRVLEPQKDCEHNEVTCSHDVLYKVKLGDVVIKETKCYVEANQEFGYLVMRTRKNSNNYMLPYTLSRFVLSNRFEGGDKLD